MPGRAVTVAATCLLLACGGVSTGARGGPMAPPGTSRWAAGFAVGFSEPVGGDDFDTELLVAGSVEFHQTEQLSWRAALSYLAFDGRRGHGAPADDVDLLAFNGNAVYHWPVGGMARPFVTAGLGLYLYDPERGDAALEVGVDFGAGVDFQLLGSGAGGTRIAVQAEGLFHGTSGREPDSFFNGTLGIQFLW